MAHPSADASSVAGGSTTLINDKDVKLNMMVMYIPADFFKLYELQAVQGTLPGKVEAKDYSENVVVMNEAALKAFGLYEAGRSIRKRRTGTLDNFLNGREK